VPVLPVLDALERSLATGSTDPTFYEGVAAIGRMFIDALRSAGVEPVESDAQPFDPAVHEAVATTPPDGRTPAPSPARYDAGTDSTVTCCAPRRSSSSRPRRPPVSGGEVSRLLRSPPPMSL
jgi:hypothetical protein